MQHCVQHLRAMGWTHGAWNVAEVELASTPATLRAILHAMLHRVSFNTTPLRNSLITYWLVWAGGGTEIIIIKSPKHTVIFPLLAWLHQSLSQPRQILRFDRRLCKAHLVPNAKLYNLGDILLALHSNESCRSVFTNNSVPNALYLCKVSITIGEKNYSRYCSV